ncbi:hypothetical protein A7K91_03025 [Paenibacillus oryzae]|uniref:Uncharacterized protein n=1 Tax=Paenibacillus oryzae TaxID=1844972 RepID=A0A1A5YB42_9BACL|nr:hypothetical protein A7K91_03025 [Paenibacillus oryzae]
MLPHCRLNLLSDLIFISIKANLYFFASDFAVALRNMPVLTKKFSSHVHLYRQFTAAIRQAACGRLAVFVGSLDNGCYGKNGSKPLWAQVAACDDKSCAAVHFVGKNFWGVYDN